jgi:hypothetical protein
VDFLNKIQRKQMGDPDHYGWPVCREALFRTLFWFHNWFDECSRGMISLANALGIDLWRCKSGIGRD